MKILKLQAENIKRLKAIEVVPDPEKGLVIISGKNNMGKTSLLDSIWFGLGGKRAIQSKPIREGQEKASVKLDLGDYLVERIWKGENTHLRVQNKEGASFPSPQALLDRLTGDLTFDPLAFANSDKDVQIKTIQDVINLPFDAEDFNRAVGAETDPHDGNPLEIIQQTYQEFFDARTQVGRDLKNAEGTWETLEGPEEKIESVSVTELFNQRKELEDERSHRNEFVDYMNELKLKLAEKAKRRIKLIQEIVEHKQAIQEAEGYLKSLVIITKTMAESLAAQKKKLETTPPVNFTEIDGKIELADETNNRARLWKAKQDAGQQVEKLDAQRKELTGKLKTIEDYRDTLVAKANMPVKGLGFDEDGITFNGIPFEQVGSAMRLRISTAVAMALNPTLRVIRITDGSLLDSENLKMLEEMANEKDYQIWLELVRDDGTVGIYIEDGMIVEKDTESQS